MKKALFVSFVVIFLILVVISACSSNQQSNVAKLKELAGPPPASLDQYFPPKAQAPVFLIEMFNLAGPFEGIGIDLQEQDMPGVKANFQAFQTQYTKVSKMVPEWTSRFPNDPVTALGKAIDSGNPAQIGPAMGNVGQVCGDCHLLYLVKVEQKYHWRNFDDVKVTDPVGGKELKWGDYMVALGGSFEGAMVDLQEGQLDKARQNLQAFTTQFKAMADTGCRQCHVDQTGKEIPRKYYVDADSMAMINQMSKALSTTPPDGKAVGDLAGAIGNEVCLKCHLVHLPAQQTKDLWDQYKDVLK